MPPPDCRAVFSEIVLSKKVRTPLVLWMAPPSPEVLLPAMVERSTTMLPSRALVIAAPFRRAEFSDTVESAILTVPMASFSAWLWITPPPRG
jgi:hypothetical protein